MTRFSVPGPAFSEPGRPRPGYPPARVSAVPRARAFTLIELMVVLTIIILAVSIAAPAIGPMLASNQMAEAMGSLNGLLTTAQTAAQANGTPVGLRIERAFETNDAGLMVDGNGLTTVDPGFRGPVWLPHQQVRLVIFSPTRATQGGFREFGNSKVTRLPKGVWIAPDYALAAGFNPLHVSNLVTPSSANTDAGVPYNLFETFYVVFNRQGDLDHSTGGTSTWYADRTQPYEPRANEFFPRWVDHPYPYARSLVLYERDKLANQPSDAARLDTLRREGRPVHISRSLASTVEGTPP